MPFIEIFSSKRVLVSFSIVVLFSILLTFFPLIGSLGYEYSVAIAFLMSFISVFIAAEFINPEYRSEGLRERRYFDVVSSIYAVNFFIFFVSFIIGLLSSIIKKGCFISEGITFFILIPFVTVFFSTSLGLLTGTVYPRRGFFLGSFLIIFTICFSLWDLYFSPGVFFYNPVFGFFPGPLYDEFIPITLTLVIYRIMIFCWGLFFLIVLSFIRGIKYKQVGVWDYLALFIMLFILVFAHYKGEDIGIKYSREYITEKVLTASIETQNFRIFYEQGTQVEKHINLIAADHEWRYRQLREFLRVDPKQKIRSYIYPDNKTRKKYMGAGDTTIANPIHREIHLVYSTFPHPLLKHEITHILSAEFGTRILKISPKIGLIEGLAVAADWNLDGLSKHEWSQTMIRAGDAPEINDIIGLGFWFAPAKKSYTLMGSFSRFLIDEYGIERFKELYKTGSFTPYSKSLDELTSEWKSFLDSIYLPEDASILAEHKFSEQSIFESQCPRKVASLKDEGFSAFRDGNYYKAKMLFLKALSFNKTDPVLIDSLAYAYYYNKDYQQLLSLVELDGPLPSVDKAIIENLAGNVLWNTGETERARSVFASLLNRSIPGDLERELLIKISSMFAGQQTEDNMREVFSTKDKLVQVSLLEEIIRKSPEYSPAYYLLGKLFFINGDYERAARYLLKSDKGGLYNEILDRENLRLLGISLYAIGNYEGAVRTFQRLKSIDPDGILGEYSNDFIKRSEWAEKRKLN